MSHNSVKEECPTGVSSHMNVQKACQVRVSYKSVEEACQVRVSYKSVTYKSVPPGCQISVSSQGVPQLCLVENATSIFCVP